MTLELLFDRIALAAGLLALVSSLVAWRWRRSRPLLIPCFIITALLTGVALWHNHRPLPSNERRMLFQGVEYVHEVRPGREDPKIVHVVRIDLTTPGLSFLVTPHNPVGEYEQAALTTSSFLRANHLSLAINADGFQPWEPGDLINFYPREGDGINLHGPSVSLGDRYSDGYSPPGSVPTLHLSAQNQASINSTPAHPYNLISGLHTLVVDGEKATWQDNAYMNDLHPRTAVAVDQSGRHLILLVVDGRQANYSEGATLDEAANLLLEFGAWDAINLDGGGSTTLVIADSAGNPVQLNSPIHTHVPGRERPVGNHLGLIAPPLAS